MTAFENGQEWVTNRDEVKRYCSDRIKNEPERVKARVEAYAEDNFSGNIVSAILFLCSSATFEILTSSIVDANILIGYDDEDLRAKLNELFGLQVVYPTDE